MSLSDFAAELENAPEIGPVPGDQEYRLTLRQLTLNTKEDGRKFLMASVDFPDEPCAEEMGVFVGWVVSDNNDANYRSTLDQEGLAKWNKQKARSVQDIKKFFAGFGLPLALVREFDESQERPSLEAAKNMEGKAVIGLRASKRNEGESENYIKQWMPK